MAEAFAASFGKGIVEAYSAGSHPAPQVNPDTVRVMKEIDLDLSQHRSKSIQDLAEKRYDYVVTMRCGEVCPVVPTQAVVAWDIPDPKGKGLGVFRAVRDQIALRVRELLEEIKSSQES